MAIRSAAPQASVTDVLDRVLDRGIVIDAWLRVSVAGITLLDVDAHVVVASIDTYVRRSDALGLAPLESRPRAAPAEPPTRSQHRGRRPRRRLRCESGCTFIRPVKGCPSTVRCPSDRRRACPVTAIPRAA